MPRLRVLLVDDDATIRDIVAEALREKGFEVVSAANAGETLIALRTPEAFDALILDDQMPPGLSGRQLLDLLRRQGVTTAAILHSGSLRLSEQECVRLDIHCVVAKPARTEELAAAIRSAARADEA